MIRKKIEQDVKEEFAILQRNLQIHLNPDFDVSQTSKFLQKHIPREILSKSGILLDTLLNYLMDDARERIKDADVKFQNAFFEAEFRKRVQGWANHLENKLELQPDLVNFSSDPRIKQGLIASGITFVGGAGVTLIFTSTVIGAIVSGLVTILLSALAFKVAHDRAAPKAREKIKMDIDQYLDHAQKQVIEWLEKVEIAFENDFTAFCANNGFDLKGYQK